MARKVLEENKHLDMNIPSLVPEPDPQLQVLQTGFLEPIPGMGICTPSGPPNFYLVSLLCPQMVKENCSPQPSPSALPRSPSLWPFIHQFFLLSDNKPVLKIRFT